MIALSCMSLHCTICLLWFVYRLNTFRLSAIMSNGDNLCTMYFELCTAQARLSFGLTWCKMCTGLPVAGHGEWMALLSLPRAERDAHLQPQMQNMMQCLEIILAGNDDVPLPRAPPVCVKCNGLWLCKCGIIEYSHKCRRSRSRSRSRSISVFQRLQKSVP